MITFDNISIKLKADNYAFVPTVHFNGYDIIDDNFDAMVDEFLYTEECDTYTIEVTVKKYNMKVSAEHESTNFNTEYIKLQCEYMLYDLYDIMVAKNNLNEAIDKADYNITEW